MGPSFFRDFSPAVGWSQRMSSCAEWLYRIALLGVSLIVLILMGSMSCKKGWVYRFLLEQIYENYHFFATSFFGGQSFLQLGRLLVQKGAPDFLQFLETKWMAQEAELDACCTVGILVVGTCSTSNKRQIPNLCAHSQFFGCFFGGGRGRGKHKESSVWCWDLALRRDSRPGPDSRMSHPGCFFFSQQIAFKESFMGLIFSTAKKTDWKVDGWWWLLKNLYSCA